MQYMTLDPEKETKRRLRYIEGVHENLKDAQAELDDLRKRNPLHSRCDFGNRAASNPAIAISHREQRLLNKIAEYEVIIGDIDRGWRILDDEERDILSYRFKRNMKQDAVAKIKGCDRSTIYRIEREALKKMASQMT